MDNGTRISLNLVEGLLRCNMNHDKLKEYQM